KAAIADAPAFRRPEPLGADVVAVEEVAAPRRRVQRVAIPLHQQDMRRIDMIEQRRQYEARIIVARCERSDRPDLDARLVDSAIGNKKRSCKPDADCRPAQRTRRQRMVGGIDAAQRDSRQIEHGKPDAALAYAGAGATAAAGCVPAASSRQRSAPRTTTSGARCSVARLSVV